MVAFDQTRSRAVVQNFADYRSTVPSKLRACAAAQLAYNPRAVLRICRAQVSGGEDLFFNAFSLPLEIEGFVNMRAEVMTLFFSLHLEFER